MKILDLRGLKCPVPVLKAYKAFKKDRSEKGFIFLTDDPSAPKDFKDFYSESNCIPISESATVNVVRGKITK